MYNRNVMKFKLENYIPDVSDLLKKLPKQYDFIATQIELPGLGKVWYLNNQTLSSILNGYQYAIKDGKSHVMAEHYPQNAYLIHNSQTNKLSVVRSILLTYKKDRIIAKRRSIGNVPVWELIDKEYIRIYTDIQAVLSAETTFLAECFANESYIVKHHTLKQTIAVNKKFQHTAATIEPSIEKIPMLKYTSMHAIPLFHRYFDIEDSALNFIDLPKIERYKIANTSFNEVFAVGSVLNSLKKEEFDLEKEVGIVTLFEEQKHILADFYGEMTAHSSDKPKIGLPDEMTDRQYAVLIVSFTLTSKLDKHSQVEKYEYELRQLMDSVKEGIIFVGNMRILSHLHGFARELTGLIKALKNVSHISHWTTPGTYQKDMLEIWQAPIKRMDPERTKDNTQKVLWSRYYKNIQLEYQKKNIMGMKSIYKDYLRSLGIGKEKKKERTP